MRMGRTNGRTATVICYIFLRGNCILYFGKYSYPYEALLRAYATTPTVYVHVAIRTTLQRKWQWQRQRQRQRQDHSYKSRLFTYTKSEASGQWRTQMMPTMRMSGLRHSEKTSFQTMICWRIHGALSRDIVSNTCHFHTSTPYVPSL